MRVLLAIPFRDTDGSRRQPFMTTVGVLFDYYNWTEVVTVDSGHHIFNRAASRNLAFQYAADQSYDVVCCNDADTSGESDGYVKAIVAAHTNSLINYPFTLAFELIPKAIAQIGNAPASILRNRAYSKCHSEGGVYIASPEVWMKAGWQDPRFTGWGCEDRAFISSNKTLVGMPLKQPEDLFCLYHNRPQDTWLQSDVDLLFRYDHAYGNPIEMRELVNEREPRTDYSCAESWTSEERGPTVRVVPRDLPARYKAGYRS